MKAITTTPSKIPDNSYEVRDLSVYLTYLKSTVCSREVPVERDLSPIFGLLKKVLNPVCCTKKC